MTFFTLEGQTKVCKISGILNVTLSTRNKKNKTNQNKKPHRLHILKTRVQDLYCRDFVVVCHAIAKFAVRPAWRNLLKTEHSKISGWMKCYLNPALMMGFIRF